MATISTQVYIEEATKEQASRLLEELGFDLSEAINIFLRQVVLHGGMPFKVEYPNYRSEIIDAMEEARLISRDANIKGNTSVKEMLEDILSESADD